jgi:isopentenyl diphosphate isomerase/L-lactate dehydrogenase-like FMN-dependent dehydrogenase
MSSPLNIEEIEGLARQKLPREVFDYYAGGAWDLQTLQENRNAYRRLRIYYRVLRDVSQRSTACEIFGSNLAMPILAAPTAFHRLAHSDGELATARGVGAAKTVMVLSSLSSCHLEDVAAAASGPLWFQVYINKDREFTRDLLKRAVAAGFKAIVVTCDAPCWGVREADIRNGFHLPPGIEPVNLTASYVHSSTISHHGAGMGQIMSWMLDPSLTWKDIEAITSEVSVPVIVKGICRVDDALQAVRHGARGVIVSNHGGRQLDGAPATIEALPAVVQGLGGRVPVLVDGGIRRGTDVLKALASGASAVLVGRPVLWGLATNGESGVAEALEMLRKEFDLAMALSGCAALDEITPDLLGKPS